MPGHHTDAGAASAGPILLIAAAAVALYAAAAGWQRRPMRRWSRWRTGSFAVGVGLVALALSPPVAHLAHHDFRGHVVQHLLIGMFAPLALVLAAPVTLALRTLPARASRRIVALLRSRPAHWLSHPACALLLSTGGMYLLYLTPLYAAVLASPGLHRLVNVHFLAAGYLFAAVVVGADPLPRRPSMRARLAALFLSIAAHAALGKLMYAYLWPRGTPHDAEAIRAGAQLMYYGGDAAELLLAVALFGGWYAARGRRPGRPSAPQLTSAPGSPPDPRAAHTGRRRAPAP